ncbi:MAG: DUF5312 family protein [Spirochaetota bacterium]
MSKRFRELVKALPEQERAELYRKITKSLSLDYDHSDHLYPVEMHRDQWTGLVEKDIAQMSLGMRIRVWLRHLLTGHDRQTCFLEVRLKRLQHTLHAAGLKHTDVATDSVDGAIASHVFDIYRAAYPVIPLFKHLWSRKESLRLMIHHLLSAKVPEAKSSPEDLLPRREMEDIFLRTQRKSEIRRELLERLETYLSGIPAEAFAHIESGIAPLYFLRDICLYDYQTFFERFGYRPGLAPPQDRPAMRNAPAAAVVPQLEELYYAVYTALKVPRRFFVHRDLLAGFATRNERGEDEEGTPESQGENAKHAPMSEEEREGRVDSISDHLHTLHDSVRRFKERVPLVELIRYIRRDPYYRIIAYPPQLDLKAFYENSMRIEVLSRLDEIFPEIRHAVIERLIREVMGGDVVPLSFLPQSTPQELRKLGLPVLRNVRALNILHDYLKRPFRRDLREFLRVLSRMMPSRRKETSNAIVSHADGLRDIEERAEQLDAAFAPDADSGKLFHRVRHSAEDASRHPAYRNLISQTDKEIALLLDKALDHIEGIRAMLQELLQNMPEALKERYALYDPTDPHTDALEWKLAEQSNTLLKLHTLIAQTIAVEEAM